MIFSRDKVSHYCFSRLCAYLLHGTLLLGLYPDSRGRMKLPKQKLKVKLWCLCTGIATIWKLYCYHWARSLQKHQKRHYFEIASLLELEQLRKMHDLWPFLGAIFTIFVVLDVTQMVPHVCIAHMSCFQSWICMSAYADKHLVYSIYEWSHADILQYIMRLSIICPTSPSWGYIASLEGVLI